MQAEEREQWSRHQLLGVLPLPRRVTPHPSEDLASMIVRTAQAMGYPEPSWILRPEKVAHAVAPGELALLRRQFDYELLMRLLDIDEATLYRLTLHRFAMRMQGTSAEGTGTRGTQPVGLDDGLPWLENARWLFSHTGDTSKVCPGCLDEPGGYQRLYWRAAPTLLCPRHRVWLLDSCPACQKPIPGLRPQLSTCPACGGDYRRRLLPLDPEANWVRDAHCVFLTHLGIEVDELGESPPAEARSLLHVLPSQEYFWIVTQFLGLLYEGPYRGRLLPLLLRALPVENLAPTHIQSALLLLHYLLDSWPVHFWIALERLQPALEEDSLWSHPSYAPARQWEAQLIRGVVWDQGASREQTMDFLRAFFEMAKDYFQPHRYPGRHDAPLARHIAPAALPIAHQLRPAAQKEPVAPRPWEDLASFVGRAARSMRYEFPDWALISLEPPRRKVYSRELPLLHRLADYQVLERALGLGEAELYHMTLHRFAARLQSPERGARAPSSYPTCESIDRPLLSRSTVRRVDISRRTTKVCPGCLDEAPAYDRLFWRLRPVILCPYHALLLLDRCSYCSAPIPGQRRSPGRCPFCRREYLQAPRALIAPTSWLYEGQTLLLHQLTAENANGWTGSPAFAGSPVLKIEPWHYFALLERFENFLQPRLSGSIVMQTLKKLAWEDKQSTSESPVIQKVALQMALFHYLLASWPENLLAALDRIPPLLKGQQERRGVSGDSWQAEADRLVQRIRSASIVGDAPFVLLSQVFDTFFTWATLTGIPASR